MCVASALGQALKTCVACCGAQKQQDLLQECSMESSDQVRKFLRASSLGRECLHVWAFSIYSTLAVEVLCHPCTVYGLSDRRLLSLHNEGHASSCDRLLKALHKQDAHVGEVQEILRAAQKKQASA